MDRDAVKKGLKEAIYQRRSTRAYLDKPVPEEIIEEILDAGRHAPSASNKQRSHFFVITNPEKLAELREVMTGVLAAMPEQEGMSPVIISLIQRAKAGPVDVTYGAPALIVTTNIMGGPNGLSDTACALQNMMLTASALGMGNCWINQFLSLRDAPPLRKFFEGLGVPDDQEVCGSLALGYAAGPIEPAPLPRTGNPVTYIR
ncbi:MAG: nitroreductase [Clostridiales bacterium]|nr:nitroreductase [Clostridiales bacterium]